MFKKKSNPKHAKIMVIVSTTLFFCAGIAVIYGYNIHYRIVNRQVRSSWVQVPCEIESLRLETKTVSRRRTGKGAKGYEQVQKNFIRGGFTYNYDGRLYTSINFNFMQNMNATYIFYEQLSKYKRMSNPLCYVNPENPQEAVLDPYIAPFSFGALFLGMMAIGISLFMIWCYRYEQKTKLAQKAKTEFDFTTDIQF